MEGDLGSTQNKFFDAMICGWVCSDDAKKIEVPEFPGSKGILYEHGPFRVLDCFVAKFNFSTDTITI